MTASSLRAFIDTCSQDYSTLQKHLQVNIDCASFPTKTLIYIVLILYESCCVYNFQTLNKFTIMLYAIDIGESQFSLQVELHRSY